MAFNTCLSLILFSSLQTYEEDEEDDDEDEIETEEESEEADDLEGDEMNDYDQDSPDDVSYYVHTLKKRRGK